MANIKVVQQTNKQTGQTLYVPAIATGGYKKFFCILCMLGFFIAAEP